MIKAILCDMDGVMVDTEPLKFQAYQEVFRTRFGVQIADDSARLGLAERPVMELYLNKHGLVGDVSAMIAEKRQAYYEIIGGAVLVPAPGFPELLGDLRLCGILAALCTSSDRKSTDIILARLNLRSAFAVVVTQEDVQNKKPDPEIYLTTAARLGFAPEVCAVLEDSPAGILAGKRAGMACVGIASGVSEPVLLDAGADLAVSDFSAEGREQILRLLGK